MTGLMYESNRILLGVISSLCFLFVYLFLKIRGIWFYPRTQGYLVTGSWSPKQYWLQARSYSVWLILNQILLVYYHKLCATSALAYLVGRTLCTSRICDWLGIYVYILLACRVPSCSKDTGALKALNRNQINYSKCNKLCRCLQQLGLAVSIQTTNYSLDNSLSSLGIPVGLWPKPQLDITESQYWKLLCLQEMVSWDSVILFYLMISFKSLLYVNIFQECFHTTSQMSLTFSCLSLFLSSSSSHLLS